jgi:apolipoprotein N-acyltransferase
VSGAAIGQAAACVAVTVISGWLYRLSSGLRPVAVAVWAAPLPLLILAPRVPWVAAVSVAAGAWLIGQLGLWSYYTRDVKMPRPLTAVQFAAGCVGVAFIMGLARAHLMNGHLALAALAIPVAWAAMEFLVAFRSPHGAWWSLAYTQADVPTITQVASLTGVWGITALLAVPASVVAAVTAPAGTNGERVVVLLVAAAVVAALMGYAVRRRRRAVVGEQVHVGLAVVEQPDGPVPIDSPEGALLVSRYVERVRLLAGRGARVIVMPEVTFTVHEVRMADQLQLWRGRRWSWAWTSWSEWSAWLRPGRPMSRRSSAPAATHQANTRSITCCPGWRPPTDQVATLLYLPNERRIGVLICKDLDFPGLVRTYRRGGAEMLLAPAWDFVRDGWLRSRMAILRGVESGVAVARVARGGLATVSDALGRIAVEADTSEGAAVDAKLPLAAAPTAYSRLGDWFGWCCVAATALMAVTLI